MVYGDSVSYHREGFTIGLEWLTQKILGQANVKE
jgi:hypothetical protein